MVGGIYFSTRNLRRAVNLLVGTALTLAICSLSALSQDGAPVPFRARSPTIPALLFREPPSTWSTRQPMLLSIQKPTR